MGFLFHQLHAAFHRPATRIYRVVQGNEWGLIVLSIALLVVEALPPEDSPAEQLTRRADRALLAIFAVEILLRVGTFQPPSLRLFQRPPVRRLRDHVLSRLRYLLRPIMTPVTLLGRILGGVLMVAGLFALASFAGIVGSSVVRSVLSIREEQFRMTDYANHIVVYGWDESTHLLLDALAGELDLSETRVVLFDEPERPRDLPPDFLWVQGDPTKESELDKVRFTHAAGVVVSGKRDIPPQTADARTILIRSPSGPG